MSNWFELKILTAIVDIGIAIIAAGFGPGIHIAVSKLLSKDPSKPKIRQLKIPMPIPKGRYVSIGPLNIRAAQEMP